MGRAYCSLLILAVAVVSSSSCSRSQGEYQYSKEYKFKSDWFSPHIRLWKEKLGDFEGKPNIRYLEIGVFEGRSLLWMLENILTDPTATVTAIDPLNEVIAGVWMNNLALSGENDRIDFIKGYSQAELGKLPINSYDIIYIDGDHEASGVLADAVLCWPLLKKDGILIFDDYDWDMEGLRPEKKPQMAIDAFLASYTDYIEVLHKKYQCMIRKKSLLYWEEMELSKEGP